MKLSLTSFIELSVLVFFACVFLCYIALEFVLSYHGVSLAPIKTGRGTVLFAILSGGSIAWCIDRLIHKIRTLAGKNKRSAEKESAIMRSIGKIFEKYF